MNKYIEIMILSILFHSIYRFISFEFAVICALVIIISELTRIV